MNYYDLHIHSAFSEGESSIEQLAEMAKQLGYSGVCFAEYFGGSQQLNKLKNETAKIASKVGIEIFLGFEARTLSELDRLREWRRKFDVLLVRGGDLRLNRAACETKEVDILTHPSYGRYDCGLNQVLMKLAAKNNVAIELNFREILISTKKTRNIVLANMQELVKLAKKYKAPIILCSGSISHWTLRDPMCMQSMAMQLGLTLVEAKKAMTKVPEDITSSSKKKTRSNWVTDGVKIVK
jgi:ribonuclease P/MRP protein subunit RPP1